MIEVVELEIRGTLRPRLRVPTLRLAPGHVYGLIGPNGAGKSSLMAVLAGLLPVAPRVLSGLPWQRGRPTGAVLGSELFHPGRTVRETLSMRAAYLGVRAAESTSVARRVGLESVLGRRVEALSLGMKMRLAIGAALLGAPSLVLLDEPLNGLDPDGIAWIRTVVKGLRSEGVTVVVSSHLLGELEPMIDTAVLMSEGAIVAVEPMEHAVASSVLIEVSDPEELLRALSSRGLAAQRDGFRVVAECPAADIVRLAVALDIDVHAIGPSQSVLEHLYDATVSAEHRSGHES